MTVNYPEFLPARPEPSSRTGGPAPYRHGLKRVLDLAAVLAAAPFVVPLVAGLALMVRRDGGPAFYVQERVGRDGRMFRMWKLRSMVTDADRRMAEHLAADPEAQAEWNLTQKLRRDPRITRFGRFLRMSSLDELPQLWNVVKGEMSLIGPRPMMPDQRPLYPGKAYFRLRPGLTGHWQTAGRNATSFAARADYDSAYDRELSLWTDIRILIRTVGVVLRGTGC